MSEHQERRPNRLVHEKSPYLLQHAHNPVDWYPWGEEAFRRAAGEQRPIFLSIGYSTCHWCHVMERESFENDAVADALNAWFVPVKVDREERPDVDRVYMNAALAMLGQGGWPLSVFLTPDGKPFYAGTYFPPDARYGRPGFLDVLRGIHEAWSARRDQVTESAGQLADLIARALRVTPAAGGGADFAPLVDAAYEQLDAGFDETWGGFGAAPKFPQPGQLFFLFREWAARGVERPRAMALYTLRRMAMGGIHDHLGGGFHRYSTDAEWRVPHFEKMLYDQAQLACAYLEAFQASGDAFFAGTARDVIDYVARDLSHPEGAFLSAEDADSPGGEEGAFYAWTVAEVEERLGAARAVPFLRFYGCTAAGNFERGANVLHATESLEETASRFQLGAEELGRRLAEDRAVLLAARARRPRPHRDDKVLTAWNGLMISACARAWQVLEDPEDLRRAQRAADFLWRRLRDPHDGRLKRRFRDGEAAIDGELSDHAFYVQGLLDLYEAGFRVEDLERALALTERQIELFWDEAEGGFFDTAAGADPRLWVRAKEAQDGAEPSGNSIATLNLARLARMTGRADLEEKARRTLALLAGHAARAPLALTQLWVAARFLERPPLQIVIAGDPGAPDTRGLLQEVQRPLLPRKVLLLADGGPGQEWLGRRLEFVRDLHPRDGRATAYVCEDFACKLPVDTRHGLAEQLAALEPVTIRP